ncbi:MAG TPA: potassium-transporting ATPase subunit KdpC [Coriobacteriia bacterium]|nr:potassium-transporting ATPase subunit KdpC [Coriobacteriia bacterium]
MSKAFWRALSTASRLTVITIVLVGVVYPLSVWAIGQVAFKDAAAGSFVRSKGQIVGSRLIGQQFVSDGYFHGRPSAAGEGYDAMASAASNLGPTSKVLIEQVGQRVAEARESNGAGQVQVPVDFVTASASGLDPDISPDSALLQVARVAKTRGIDETELRRLVEEHVTGPQFGLLGAQRVNVLELNLALDDLAARK